MRSSQRVAAAATATATAVAVAAAVRSRRETTAGWPVRRDGRYVTLRGITINRPPEVVYEFWRDLGQLAHLLDRDALVEVVDQRHSRWTVAGPAGRPVSWDAEIIADEPPKLLAWRADSPLVPHEGRVEFAPAPGDRGTELRVGLTFDLPVGPAAEAVTRLTGDEPDQVLRGLLRRVKQVLESGEVITVDGQVSGRGRLQQRMTEVMDHRLATGGRP
jgi:uncharacterized membrane protein